MTSPIYLFSDSQLLFWKDQGRPFATRFLKNEHDAKATLATYIGASNGDNPDYFEIFQQAMNAIGVNSCEMIPSNPQSQQIDFLSKADIILLAGGDVKKGWEVMQSNGVAERIRSRYLEGATLIGISAGAIQLSLMGFEGHQAFNTFQLVPYLIDVHDEANDWEQLKQNVTLVPERKAFGIPFGAGLVYNPDEPIKMIRYPSIEI